MRTYDSGRLRFGGKRAAVNSLNGGHWPSQILVKKPKGNLTSHVESQYIPNVNLGSLSNAFYFLIVPREPGLEK